jgi:hypothetical protein
MSTQAARKRKHRQRNFNNPSKAANLTSPTNSTSLPAPAAQNSVASGLMAHPFASSNSSGGFIPNHGYSGVVYPLPGFGPAQNGQHQQGYAQFHQPVQVNGSSGNSDLDILERLKREILAGQNPQYTAIPNPTYLESLYLGRPGKDVNGSVAATAAQTNTSHQVEKVQREVQTEVISAEVPDHKEMPPPIEPSSEVSRDF